MRLKYFTGLLACVGLISQAIGCGRPDGPPLGIVTGIVTMNDEPVSGANIKFTPKHKGSPSYGSTDDNGAYRLLFNQSREGAEVGDHSVVIEYPEPETDDSGRRIGPKPAFDIPQKYRQPGGLSVQVEAGRNNLNFVLNRK
jgi:hypothetical protein